jgi:hypothetical protein
MPIFSTRKFLVLMAATPLLLAGCSMRTTPSTSLAGVSFSGNIHGGEQPVSGAVIQLYDATNLATPLIGTTVRSDSNGNFSITGDWSSSDCGTPGDELYLVASGGNPGSGVNDNLVLMTAVGMCGALSSSNSVTINEVTTVATIVAFYPDFDPTLSSAGQYIWNGTPTEYAGFLALADPATGRAVPGANQMTLNALANSITPCVNQASVLGVTTRCDQIINGAAPIYLGLSPMDSAVAVGAVLGNPTYNTNMIFNLAPANPSFVPTLTSAPSTWWMN